MADVNHHSDTKVKSINLVDVGSFPLGGGTIHPSRRSVDGPSGVVGVEPRVMQVLVVLHEAEGSVISREMLMARCWPGVVVGDDAVNRAIGELRRALREAGLDASVETVPRVGYRLEGSEGLEDIPPPPGSDRQQLWQRRALIGGAGALGIAAMATGFGWLKRQPRDPRVEQLVQSARQALREELPYRNAQGLGFLRGALELAPNDAEVWGLSAIAWRNAAEYAATPDVAAAVRSCEQAAQRALTLDPREGNALSALATLQPFFGDWIAAESRLKAVLDVAPNALPAISHLTTLYQSAGLTDHSRQWNALAMKLDPLSPVFQFREAYKHWIYHQHDAADAQIERTLELYPRHPAVWNARLNTFAYTGRAEAGLDFLGNLEFRPPGVPQAGLDLWDKTLRALAEPDRKRRKEARDAHLGASRGGTVGAVGALMYLAYAGELDAAWQVAEGFLVQRGPFAGKQAGAERTTWITDLGWRRSMMLFTPATLNLRRDPRFERLCDQMGLTNFWKSRGAAPDYLRLDAST